MLAMIVEEDQDYADVVANTLRWDQHDIVILESAAQAVSFTARKRPDLAIVDAELPDEPGHALCTRLRQQYQDLPLIMLGPHAGSQEVIAGLRSGADDYVQKPFHPAELLARVQALLRRSGTVSLKPLSGGQRYGFEGLEVDLKRHSVSLDGVELSCTPVELSILTQLIQYPGEVLDHSFLTEQVWGYTEVSNAALLKGHISSIRRKIKAAGGAENMIRTLHGHGYSLVPS